MYWKHLCHLDLLCSLIWIGTSMWKVHRLSIFFVDIRHVGGLHNCLPCLFFYLIDKQSYHCESTRFKGELLNQVKIAIREYRFLKYACDLRKQFNRHQPSFWVLGVIARISWLDMFQPLSWDSYVSAKNMYLKVYWLKVIFSSFSIFVVYFCILLHTSMWEGFSFSNVQGGMNTCFRITVNLVIIGVVRLSGIILYFPHVLNNTPVIWR